MITITITITITVIREIRLRSFHIRTDLWKFGFFYCDLLTNQFRRHGAFSGARSAPHTRDRARGDSPTSARRTGRVCPVAVRPRVPPCAGERSERPIWIPAHRASCRGDSTLLSRTFQTLLRLRSQEGGGKRGKKALKMTSPSHVPVGWRIISSRRHSRNCQRLSGFRLETFLP